MSKILIDEGTMKLALDAMQRIEDADMDCDFLNIRQADQLEEAITALRKARAAQPAREWVGLTDEDKCTVELDEAEVDPNWIDGYKSGLKDAEAKLREKNT